MNYRDQDNFLNIDMFDDLQKTVDKLTDSEDSFVQKIKIRMTQSLEFYHIEKEIFLSDSSYYPKAMIALAVVTTRISENAWGLWESNKDLAKEIVAKVYELHDILKESL